MSPCLCLGPFPAHPRLLRHVRLHQLRPNHRVLTQAHAEALDEAVELALAGVVLVAQEVDLLVRQRRTFESAKRRELLAEIQRYLAKQQYYIQLASPTYIAVWDGALKNYGPNLGYDYGGRLMAAWLDR